MPFVASLAVVLSIFCSIVVYGAGVALSNFKNAIQGFSVLGASVAFLCQQILYMALIEGAPDLDCYMTNASSYACLVVLRASILAGLYARTGAATRNSRLLLAATMVAVLMVVAAIIITITYAYTSPYGQGGCFQTLDQRLTTASNTLLVVGYSILTCVMAVPIFKAFSRSPGSEKAMSRVQSQARYMLRLLKLIPLSFCIIDITLLFTSPPASRPFAFFTSLVLSDFCQIWLLLFPLVVMASDNVSTDGDESRESSGMTSKKSVMASQHR
ncbi:hypothetical protein HK105_205990 [Polyrhizophydium stewartii]|uniref:Uncharacterized protein n=1 Tax=Polyrhizophydium stewartii TaxID=2732419 RepID=A0ABR4N4G6_9FUNG|nr:hypothetical protein HK105_002834 [Polyrhizophydium stewartii]